MGEITQPLTKITVPLCEYTEIEGRAFWEASERFDDDEDYPAKKDAFSQTKSWADRLASSIAIEYGVKFYPTEAQVNMTW